MILNRRTGFAAAISCLAAWATCFGATPAAAEGAQFCIARGGINGDSSFVGNCVYSDYQQCLQAAAEQHGNCVQNIDYRPGAAPVAPRSRRAR